MEVDVRPLEDVWPGVLSISLRFKSPLNDAWTIFKAGYQPKKRNIIHNDNIRIITSLEVLTDDGRLFRLSLPT